MVVIAVTGDDIPFGESTDLLWVHCALRKLRLKGVKKNKQGKRVLKRDQREHNGEKFLLTFRRLLYTHRNALTSFNI
ncbi:hypothetical protein SCA6_002655 [Theobroma cacao]